MLHLVATETYYQLNTCEDKKWDSWPDSVKQQWDAPMNLGDVEVANRREKALSRLLVTYISTGLSAMPERHATEEGR